MKFVDLIPSKEWHTSGVLKGGPGVPDLPMTRVRYDDGTIAMLSVWRVSFWRRVRFLFDGRINFIAMGETHPPVCIGVGEFIKKSKDGPR